MLVCWYVPTQDEKRSDNDGPAQVLVVGSGLRVSGGEANLRYAVMQGVEGRANFRRFFDFFFVQSVYFAKKTTNPRVSRQKNTNFRNLTPNIQ